MKSKKTRAAIRRKKFLLPPLFGLFVLGRAAEAQQYSVIQPQAPPVESITQLNMTNQFQVFPLRPAATTPAPYEPFSWDQFVIRPHADYQFIYAQGILAAPSNHVNTVIQNISPGVLLNLGPHWALDYTASIGLYSNTNFTTAFNNLIILTGQTVYSAWIFGFQQTADLSNSPLIETGSQTSQQNYGTAVTGTHQNSPYISEDLAVFQNFQYTESGFENMRTWSTMNWLNYQPQSRFNMGLGLGLGYNNADFGPDSVYEQVQARVNWRARDKLSFQLSGGIQLTQFLGSEGAANLFSPIFGGSVQYQLFSETQLSLFANHSVSPTIFVGQYSESTSAGASFSQRFLGQIFLNVSGSYILQKYVSSSILVATSRTDKLYSLSVRLSHSFLQRGTASIFYQYGRDDSTYAGYTYNSNQYGVEVNYAF